ncbi:MAG: ABC transporter ATP-binding protein [Clostridia bacterium]|nr:ABC transporter ATP-binding protein [Clostridia bacterium]
MLFGKHINRYYIKYMPSLLLGLLALVAVDYFQLVVPELYKMVVNGINDGVVVTDGVSHLFNMDFLLEHICKPLLGVIIIMVIGRFLWRICFFGAAIKMETDLRGRMFDHCKDLSQQYYQVNKVGKLMSLFTNDLETVQECFGHGVLMIADALLLGGLAIFKMFRMHGILTLLSLIPMAFLLVAGTVIGKYLTLKWDARQESFSRLSDFSQENFSGIAVVKAFVKEGVELWAFKKLNKENENANVSYTRLSTLMHISVTLFVESVICIILGYGGYLAHEGIFNAGELVEFIGYFTSVVWPIMAVSELIDMSSRGKASLSRITALFDAKPDVTDAENVHDIDAIRGDIEFKNLTFRYPGAEYDALKDVSFKINAGENVGIIGRTGSGKTTVVDLILRTYNVNSGELFIDGHDVNDIPIKKVREYTAYVPQDNFLFSETIENNIAFASDSDDENEIVNSAILSAVHDNISEFTDGYKTLLGERGVTVSGGQKQRISIARALMKNASILILDDSVSAVDVKTEKLILDNLRQNRKGKTTVLIAHRVSTIEQMDKIIYIENGSVAAIGTHSELYNSCAEYKTMVDMQRLDDLESSKKEA